MGPACSPKCWCSLKMEAACPPRMLLLNEDWGSNFVWNASTNWNWRIKVSPKHSYPSTELHAILFLEDRNLELTAVISWGLTLSESLSSFSLPTSLSRAVFLASPILAHPHESWFSWAERIFFSFGATAPIWALAYLHETLRFTSVF
jgi:hypothetical protein